MSTNSKPKNKAVQIDDETEKLINETRDTLTEKLGFTPTMPQALKHIVAEFAKR